MFIPSIIVSLQDDDWNIWILVLALTVSLSLYLMPHVYAVISRYVETYSLPRNKNYADMFRSQLLVATLILVIVIQHMKDDTDQSRCWENEFGQEMYRLLIQVPFFLILLPFIVETIHKRLQKRYVLKNPRAFPSV